MAKAHRKYFLDFSKKTETDICKGIFYVKSKAGRPLTTDQARLICEHFGPLSECRETTMEECLSLRVGPGVIATYEMYDHGQLALNVSH